MSKNTKLLMEEIKLLRETLERVQNENRKLKFANDKLTNDVRSIKYCTYSIESVKKYHELFEQKIEDLERAKMEYEIVKDGFYNRIRNTEQGRYSSDLWEISNEFDKNKKLSLLSQEKIIDCLCYVLGNYAKDCKVVSIVCPSYTTEFIIKFKMLGTTFALSYPVWGKGSISPYTLMDNDRAIALACSYEKIDITTEFSNVIEKKQKESRQ